MSAAPADPKSAGAERIARQLRIITGIACVLIALGVVVLATLRKLPMPVRMMTGCGDIFIGLILLVLVRQKRHDLLK